MPDPIPVHKNKSLADLPGEEWKDVPGFEGSFQASSLGRVKSLDRIIPHPRIGQQFVRGQIISQSVAINRNIKTGEPMTDLRVTVTMESVPYHFNTRRIIYRTFIDPHLDYDKDGLYVINVDGDGYNNRPDNLQAVTKSEKQLRAVRRDRVLPTFKTADRSGWKKNYSRCKPVEQYDLQGNLIAEFHSIKEASRQARIEDKAIIQVAKGLYKQWNGFVWKYKGGI
ncbi:MAG: hypothetical protein JWR09_4872 [Mucilaginibacter sp.]|nr:hypothetical protein [Mucilaginibacter sp.]